MLQKPRSEEMTRLQQIGVPVTLLEAGLLGYLYLAHTTSVAFHHPWEGQLTAGHAALAHLLAHRLDPPRNPICALGHRAAVVGMVLLGGRAVVWATHGRRVLPPSAWLWLYGAGLVVALVLNLNAFLYLLPSALLELWLSRCV